MNFEAQFTEKRGRCSFGKRVLAVLLALVMLLEFLPQTAWAAWDGTVYTFVKKISPIGLAHGEKNIIIMVSLQNESEDTQ